MRVGDGLAALTSLARCDPHHPDDQAVHAVLTARARLALDEPALALAALEGPVPSALEAVHAQLTLRARVGVSAAPAAITTAAERVLASSPLSPALAAEARYRRAVVDRAPGPTSTLAALQALADDPAVSTVGHRALARLAERGVAGAARHLQVAWGHTLEARRAARPPLSLAERLARAEALFRARAYDLQAPLDETLLTTPGVSAPARQAARLRLGITGLRLRDDVAGAVRHLEAASRGPDAKVRAEALYRLMLGYGRLARWSDARRVARSYLDTRPSRGRRKKARYQLGRLLHQAGDYPGAVKALQTFVDGLRRDRETWLWFVGWASYRGGDCAAAERVFGQLAPHSNSLVGAKALYWTARCAEGRSPTEALATLDRLAARAPLTYYGALGARAAHRLDPRRPRQPTRPPQTPYSTTTPDWQVPPAGAADDRVVRLLVRAGYPRLARPAADRLAPLLDPEGRDALAQAVERFGDRWRRAPDRRLPWKEALAARRPEVIRAALPPAYLALVRAAGRAEGVSPWWLLGHMLQESRFRERARSHAGALGPMQVLPRTGRRIADRLGFPAGDFFDDELYRPGVAVRHAAWYLAALRREYEGNTVFAIAAYNGGPRRMSMHARQSAELEHAALIEELGAHETRNYVRKVADHWVRFAALYGTEAEYRAAIDAVSGPTEAPQPRGEIRF